MKFVVGKDDLLNGIRIVERATVVKGLQPVLANVLMLICGAVMIVAHILYFVSLGKILYERSKK